MKYARAMGHHRFNNLCVRTNKFVRCTQILSSLHSVRHMVSIRHRAQQQICGTSRSPPSATKQRGEILVPHRQHTRLPTRLAFIEGRPLLLTHIRSMSIEARNPYGCVGTRCTQIAGPHRDELSRTPTPAGPVRHCIQHIHLISIRVAAFTHMRFDDNVTL